MGNHLRKAAIVLLSLSDAQAADLMRRFEPSLAGRLAREMARIDRIDVDEQQAVLREFAQLDADAGLPSGGPDRARRVLADALGAETAEKLCELSEELSARPFAALAEVPSEVLVAYLSDEHPQTIALVLSHLPAATAAGVVAQLDEPRQIAVLRRIAHMGQTRPEILREVEQTLLARMASVARENFLPACGIERVVDLLASTDSRLERRLLSELARQDRQLAETIRYRLFIFDDLAKLDTGQLEPVVKSVTIAQWAMALTGAGDSVRAKVLETLSPRARDLLDDEMKYLGPVRKTQIDQARQQIIEIVRRLEDAGELELRPVPAN